jgi:rSAM/selenodomain-associated transferase 1
MTSLGIFAKPPVPNKVKTRLIPDIGAANAARVYRHCLEHAITTALSSGLNLNIYLTEQSEDPLFSGKDYRIQKGNDLGSRMLNALRDQFESGANSAIIIGSDCLDLTPEMLQAASESLVEHDLVLIPTFDGGFALIGCTRLDTELFEGVIWSTDEVLERTLDNAGMLNYRVCLLETVRDIDNLQDLKHYADLNEMIVKP